MVEYGMKIYRIVFMYSSIFELDQLNICLRDA